MDADTIGAAAAMEAFKQAAATNKSSNAPAGGFSGGKASGGSPSSRPGQAAEDDDTAASRGVGSGGLQDKLVRVVKARLTEADGDVDGARHVSRGEAV